jgi:hypothetical protein
MNRKACIYIALITVAGTGVLAASIHGLLRAEHGGSILAWAAMALLTLLIGPLCVQVRPIGCRVSFSDALILLSMLLFGGHLATLTAAVEGYAASSRARGLWPKRLFNTMGMAISIYLSSLLFRRLAPEGGIWGGGWAAVGILIPLMILVAISHYFVNAVLVSIAVSLERNVSPLTVLSGSICWSGTAILVGALAATSVFVLVRQTGIMLFIPVLPIPIILYFIYRAAMGRVEQLKAPSQG